MLPTNGNRQQKIKDYAISEIIKLHDWIDNKKVKQVFGAALIN